MRTIWIVLVAIVLIIASGCALEEPGESISENIESNPLNEQIYEAEMTTSDLEMTDTEVMILADPQCTRAGQEPGTFGTISVPVANSGSSLCWMDRGNISSAVRSLQRALIHCFGYGIEPDGDYGRQTAAAVRDMQRILEIRQDGVYGRQTRQRMGSAFALVDLDRCGT